jgi:CheY-like chemotaxis protein
MLFEVAAGKVNGLKVVAAVVDGFEVISYLEGTGAYAKRTRFPIPDLLFLDIKMPGMNGFDVLAWLQKQEKKPTVIMLSGSDLAVDMEKAFSLGADYFKVKPTTSEAMVKLLQGVVDQVRAAALRHSRPSSIVARPSSAA